ncbi:MAG: AI-2E family transporter [Anaerolineae bacterium]|nr:AI-2E family transporter [Anaerolineae bacterium]
MDNSPPDSIGETAPPNSLNAAVQDAQAQWKHVGLRMRSITPGGLARGLLIATVLGLIGWLLWNAREALLPFTLGAFLAYALLPVVNWMDRFLPRPLASVLVVLATLAIAALLLVRAVPVVATQMGQLSLTLPTGERAQARIADLLAYVSTLPAPVQSVIRTALDQQLAQFQTNLSLYVESLVGTAMAWLAQVFNLIALGLAVLVSFPWVMSVINDEPKGVRLARRMVPDPIRTDVWAIVRIVDRALRTFISGQVVLGIATGVVMFAGVWTATKLGWISDYYPGLIASLAGLAQLIPAFGPYLGAVGIFFLGALISWDRAFIMLGLYLLSLFLVNLLLGDRISRRVLSAHPVLVAVFVVAISQLGLVWVLFAAPIIAILRDTTLYVYGRLSQPPRPAGRLPSEPLSAGAIPGQLAPRPVAQSPRRVVASGVRYPPRPIPPPTEADRAR